MFNTTSEKIKSLVFSNDLIFRILSFILGPIVFSSLPILFFVIYMGDNKFFSYDFFLNGIFGLNLFFISSAIIILIFSLMLTGSIIPFYKFYIDYKETKETKKNYLKLKFFKKKKNQKEIFLKIEVIFTLLYFY